MHKIFLTFIPFIALLLCAATTVAAAEFVPLVGIPGLPEKPTSLVDYVNSVYTLVFAIGALYGVLRIAYAGAKYSLTEIVTHKGDALEDIKGVLLGLFFLATPYIILNTINPNLTNLAILDNFGEPIVTDPATQITEITPLLCKDETTIAGQPVPTRPECAAYKDDTWIIQTGYVVATCPHTVEEKCQEWCNAKLGRLSRIGSMVSGEYTCASNPLSPPKGTESIIVNEDGTVTVSPIELPKQPIILDGSREEISFEIPENIRCNEGRDKCTRLCEEKGGRLTQQNSTDFVCNILGSDLNTERTEFCNDGPQVCEQRCAASATKNNAKKYNFTSDGRQGYKCTYNIFDLI